MAFTEDLSAFINPDTPGYASALVGGVEVGGLFDNAYSDAFNISGSAPALACVTADVSSVADGVAVVVNSVSYTVGSRKDGPEDLGPGITRLLLQEV